MSQNENLPPLPGGYSTMSGTTAYTAAQMREYALAAIESRRQELAPPVSPWLPIDSAPKDGTSILVLAGGEPMVAWHVPLLDGGSMWCGYDSIEDPVTHWMEIPPLPEVKP